MTEHESIPPDELTNRLYDDSREKQFRDDDGNIIKKVHPNDYDPKTEDGGGNCTAYTVDGWGRILSVETAEGGREEYAYDCAGNVTAATDANGNTTRYAYNSQGRGMPMTCAGTVCSKSSTAAASLTRRRGTAIMRETN